MEAHQARSQFYMAKFLELRGLKKEADELDKTATATKDRLLKEHPTVARTDPDDERVAYDTLVGVWDFRITGKMHGARPVPKWW